MDQIFGYIERITYTNPENGFSVARLKRPRKQELTTIVGTLANAQPGESVRLLGMWKNHATHGLQFEVNECHIETPSDVVGIQKYLESGMVRGIGPIYAERIVQKFGEKTLEVIDQTPDLLREVSGMGKKRVDQVKRCWKEQKSIREVMLFLQKHEISPGFAQKLYRLYGDETVEKLKENPFVLAQEIRGVGFKSADKIAEKLGFPKEATQRIDAGIEYVLLELSGEGHTCYKRDDLVDKAREMLGVPVEKRLEALAAEERIALEADRVWIKGLWICERGIAEQINRLKRSPSRLRSVDQNGAIAWVEKKLGIALAPNQQEAVKSALADKLHIITGGPGTGKSTITKAILTVTEQLSRSLILAAPTGRAAKRMNEITGRPASTIHSLLQYDFKKGGFKRNRENPLQCDLIIIDEASMIDTALMYHLLKALPDHARVLFVGDINQLPSVGPGNVLRDLIDSNLIALTRLTEIFRQAAGSRIITNAHRINEGIFPDLSIEKKSDFFFLKAEEPEEVLEKIVELLTRRLPRFYGLNPINDIQVLAPMKRGVIGTENLNLTLQKALNPQSDLLLASGRAFGKGDKVMQIRNNYDKEIFNGDIGRVHEIDTEAQELIVCFDGKLVTYLTSEVDELVLAYATSIHKYQGSECPCVVIPVHTTHYVMLHRNLLYTGVTRGKRLVVLVGSGKAISIAVNNNQINKRSTYLKESLLQLIEVPAGSPSTVASSRA